MLHAHVQRHLPAEDQIIQGKVHADRGGGQPDGRADVARHDPLLHAGRLTLKTKSHLQDLQQSHHQSMHHLLPLQQKS
jgi:hypothetical protein